MPYNQNQQVALFQKTEEVLSQYIPDPERREDAVKEVTDAIEELMQEHERLTREQAQKEAQQTQGSAKPTNDPGNGTSTEIATSKELYKAVKRISNPYFLEVLINQAEAQRRQLNPGFVSETPRG